MSVTPNCVDSKSEMLGETVINIFNGDAKKHMLSVHQTHTAEERQGTFLQSSLVL